MRSFASPGFAARCWAAGAAFALTAAPALAEGLPQLNPATYAPQIVWLVISFAALYLVMSRVALPRVTAALDARQERIDDALARAQALKAQADEARVAYEKGLTLARAEAQAAVRAAGQEIAAESARRHGALGERIAAEVEAAESRIEAAKQTALGEVRAIAVDVGAAIAERVAGVSPDRGRLAQLIDAVAKERG